MSTENDDAVDEALDELEDRTIEVPVPDDPRRDYAGMIVDIATATGMTIERTEQVIANQLTEPMENVIENLYDNRDQIEVEDDDA